MSTHQEKSSGCCGLFSNSAPKKYKPKSKSCYEWVCGPKERSINENQYKIIDEYRERHASLFEKQEQRKADLYKNKPGFSYTRIGGPK